MSSSHKISVYLVLSVISWSFSCEVLNSINRQLLHPLTVHSAANGFLVEEASHLKNVVVLLLLECEMGHRSSYLTSHFVQGVLEDAEIVLLQVGLDFCQGRILVDRCHRRRPARWFGVSEIVDWDFMAA